MFSKCYSLISVTIPAGVTSIDDCAFYNCNGLTSITIPDGVTNIGNSAFYNCNSLTSIIVPDGVTSIGNFVFSGCSSLTSVTIPDGVTSIGDSAFSGCSSLTSVTIPAGVTSIGDFVFSGCSSLTSITIPAGVTSIGDSAFSGCSSLNSVIIEDGVTDIGDYAFSFCGSLSSISIPSSVTSIGSWAFSDCVSLTSLIIPDGVTSIGDYAFFYCINLTSVTIGDGVTSIGDSAFSGCSNLTGIWVDEDNPNYSSDTYGVLFNKDKTGLLQVPDTIAGYVIPDSVISIGYCAFYNCSSLTSVTIPDGVTSIGDSAFECCSSLTSITIPDSVTSIGDYAFHYCNGLTSISIPGSVTSIGSSAFSGCNNLTGIWVDEDNPNYSSDAHGVLFNKDKTELLQAPDSIAECVIPDSVTSIGYWAFGDCYSLTSVTIMGSVTSIDSYAFANCWQLTDVYYYGTREQWNSISVSDGNDYLTNATLHLYVGFGTCGGNLTWLLDGNGVLTISGTGAMTNYGAEDSPFYNYDGIQTVIIQNGVTSIGNSAFYDCSGLTSITIPNSVTAVGDHAFSDCNKLADVYYVGTQEQWDSLSLGAESDCLKNATLHLISEFGTCGNGLTWMLDHEGTLTISGTGKMMDYNWDDSPFYGNSNIKAVVIKKGVTSIGSYAFSWCSSLTGVTIGDSVTTIGGSAFEGCSSLPSITIPDGVTSIGSSSFNNCTMMTSIVIPDSVTTIGSSAFSYCTSLTSINIPDGVTYIGYDAFGACESLQYNFYDNVKYLGNVNNPYIVLVNVQDKNITEFEILSNTKVIYQSAFSGCSALTNITIPDSVTHIGNRAFNSCVQLTNIYYSGKQEQWDGILIDYENECLTNATLHFHTHSYDTCVVNVQPTLSSEGSQTKTCSCGESIVESIPKLVGKVKEWNMDLGNDLVINFYLEISDSIVSTTKIQLVQENSSMTFKPAALEKTENGLYKISIHMAATQMNDSVLIIVKNGKDIAPVATYSIRQYCDTLLSDESQAEYHALIKEMLNYGAAAQAFFDYESDGAANEGIAGTGQAAVPESVQEMSVSGKAGNVRFYGASLVYESKLAVRFYFSGDISGCTFTVGDQTYTPIARNGLYYIEVSDILPQNLDKTLTVMITSGEETMTVDYSPMNYIVRMNAKGSKALKNLMRALYNYHLAAKAIQPTLPDDPSADIGDSEKTVKYTFANYINGEQYGKNEVHWLDDVVTVLTNGCYFTSQLRIYNQKDGETPYAIVQSAKAIESIEFTAGHRIGALNVYGSVDGETYTLIESIEITKTAYDSYALQMPDGTAYRYLKIESPAVQIRIKDMTVTFAG